MRFTYDDTDERLDERSPSRVAYGERQSAGKIDEAMNKELSDLPEEHQKAAGMALRPNGGPAGSWANLCADEARTALERDRAHEDRQKALDGKIEQFRESDPAKAELYGMQKDGEQKAHEAKVWQSIASKEFAMRGNTDSYQDYRREARDANKERDAIQERFNEAREAYQSKHMNPAPARQDVNQPAAVDKTSAHASMNPAPARQDVHQPAAVAPQDREQWLKDRGANAMFIKTATSSDQRFEFARKAFEAQGREASREPSQETVARLDARAEQRQAAQDKPEQADQQSEEARNRPRMR